MKRILSFAMASIFATASYCTFGIFSSTEDPMKVGFGLGTSMQMPDKSFGLGSMGTQLSFVQNIAYDLDYGVYVNGDWASFKHNLFTQPGKNDTGFRIFSQAMIRYLPELDENIFFGGLFAFSWERQFSQAASNFYKNISFGDLGFSIGPDFMMNINSDLYAYSSLLFNMNAIRFGLEHKEESYLMGTHLTLGSGFSLANNIIMYTELVPRVNNFKKFSQSFGIDLNLGVSMAI